MTARTFVIETQEQLARLSAFMGNKLGSRPLRVEVDFWRKSRSTSANRRLWKLHQRAAAASGMSAEELHRDACGEFWGWEEREVMGRMERAPKRTTTWPDVISSEEFNRFMEWREAQYAEYLGVWLT